jgi:taurine dioxygenase
MVHVEFLTPTIGAEVSDIDLHQPLDDGVKAELRQLFADRSMLLFRKQELSADDQRQLILALGPISTALLPPASNQKGRDSFFLSSEYADGQGELVPHSDHCFLEEPLWGISLYAHDVPSRGGDTVFTSAVAACQELPDELSKSLERRRAVHTYVGRERLGKGIRDKTLPDTLSAEHPVVWLHPVTGAPVLYVNPWMTRKIVGASSKESEEVLRALLSYLDDPSLRYRHQWQVGDFLIWDNIALLHARTDYDSAERRLLSRLQLGLPSAA